MKKSNDEKAEPEKVGQIQLFNGVNLNGWKLEMKGYAYCEKRATLRVVDNLLDNQLSSRRD